MISKGNRKLWAVLVMALSLAQYSVSQAGGVLDVDFDVSNFSAPASVDNAYWPLAPGASKNTFIYLGETGDGCVFDKVVADPAESKVFAAAPYSAITPLVVVDTEWEVEMECDAILVELAMDPNWEPGADDVGELTHDWYAEDEFENIWYMGEASRDFGEIEIDGIELACPTLDEVPLGTARADWPSYGFSDEIFLECTGGSWESGLPGQEEGEVIGVPGIVVPSDMPYGDGNTLSPGTSWQQEVAEGAEDMARLLKANASLSVDDDDYEECRKVKEWNPFEPGASVEHKWYCKDGPGLVLIEGIGGGPTESETLVLVF